MLAIERPPVTDYLTTNYHCGRALCTTQFMFIAKSCFLAPAVQINVAVFFDDVGKRNNFFSTVGDK